MEQKGYFRSLTSLKGLFILIIVLHNTLAINPVFSSIPGVAFLILFGGHLGNSMFYILSGFLISAAYREKIQNHAISFPEYLLRRLKKLYPMYLLSNAAMLLLEIAHYGVSVINIEKIVLSALLVRGPYNSPTGFVCALFACYVLYFAIARFSKSSTVYVTGLAFGVILGYNLLLADTDFLYLSSRNGLAYMNFFLGCILAEVYPLLSEKRHRWLQPLFLLLLPLLMGLMLSNGVEIIAGDVRVCFTFVICPMILYLALVKGPCSGLLHFKGFVALGKISSCVFFWHLVFYFLFCDVYVLITRGAAIQEPQYLLYFVLMLAFSAGFSKLEERRSNRGSVPERSGKTLTP